MPYEVHPTYQTQEIDQKLKGSFKKFSHLIQNSIENRGDFRESPNFHLKP